MRSKILLGRLAFDWPIGTKKPSLSLSWLVNQALLLRVDFRTQPWILDTVFALICARNVVKAASVAARLLTPRDYRWATLGVFTQWVLTCTHLYKVCTGDCWRYVATAGSPRCRNRASPPFQFNLIVVFFRGTFFSSWESFVLVNRSSLHTYALSTCDYRRLFSRGGMLHRSYLCVV